MSMAARKAGRPSIGVDTRVLIPVKIGSDLKDRAQRTAYAQGISMSEWIRCAMARALDEGTRAA
jgi:hypothetical protein